MAPQLSGGASKISLERMLDRLDRQSALPRARESFNLALASEVLAEIEQVHTHTRDSPEGERR
jgi:hypothetical protein